MLCVSCLVLTIEGDLREGLRWIRKMEEKRWDLKSEISELNSVPEFSFVLREEGQKSPQLWTFLTGT